MSASDPHPHWEPVLLGPQMGQEDTVQQTQCQLQRLSFLNRKPYSNLLYPAPSGAFLENRLTEVTTHPDQPQLYFWSLPKENTVSPPSVC